MERRVDSIEPVLGVVIVAGGSGVRMGGDIPKQFRFLGQLPILGYSINRFAQCYPTADIVVVLPESHLDYWNNLAARFAIAPHKTVVGGAERFHSVKAGLEVLKEGVDVVAVHDGARPMVSAELIKRCVVSALADGSAIPVVAISDSVRMIDELGGGSQHMERSRLRAVQTPQVFDAVVLKRAYMQECSSLFTDDASVVESSGERVYLVDGDGDNIKITTSRDLEFAEFLIDRAEDYERK